MAKILMLTNSTGASADVLPALGLLQHDVRILPAEASVLVDAPITDCIIIDARRDLPTAKSFTKLITTTGVSTPLIIITTEGGLSAINADWGVTDVILDTAGPAEVDARIRIVIGKDAITQLAKNPSLKEIRSGEVVIDEDSYTAKVKGRTLDLTFKEFELLKYLAQHPGRVFSRSQLLQEIWGYDYFGGTRTVDVHIRRLRSKLGPEFESIIDTVRNVGYRFAVTNAGSKQDVVGAEKK
jgi:DNA-binding response OmpR family regulator